MDMGYGQYEGTYQPMPLTQATNANLTFKNVNLINRTDKTLSKSWTATEGCAMFAGATKLAFYGCIFDGVFVNVNNPELYFEDCTFNTTQNCKYVLWIHSKAVATVKDCTFHPGCIPGTTDTDGWIKVYTEGGDKPITLNLQGCIFKGTSSEDTHNIKVDAGNVPDFKYAVNYDNDCQFVLNSDNKFIQVKTHKIYLNGEEFTGEK